MRSDDTTHDDALVLYGQRFDSRLLLGTARYPSPDVLEAAVQRARPAMLTASLRRGAVMRKPPSCGRGDAGSLPESANRDPRGRWQRRERCARSGGGC